MDDRQWLQTWQAVCQKEAEMKISQQQTVEKFRILEMKMRLMDLRVDTAFKIRDEYLNKLINKYPNWKPTFISVGLSKHNFVQSTPRNKTELAISQLVDMDMLHNWDEKITLEHLVQSKFKASPMFNGYGSPLRDESIKDIKVELEQVKKQLTDISLYLRDLKSVQIQEQPKTTVSISRRQSQHDREYSATEHIRLPKAPDSAASFDEAEKEDDFDYDKPKLTIARPAVVPKVPEARRPDVQPSEPIVQRPQPVEPEPAPTGPRFNFGPPKEPPATIIEPASPAAPAVAPQSRDPPARIIAQKPEPRIEQQRVPEPKISKPAPVAQKAEPKRDPFVVEPVEAKKSTSFFTEPIKDDRHSSTPESTPEVTKSTKVVQSYEALLGVLKEKSSDTLKKHDSDSESSSDDDIEKRMKSPPPNLPKTSLALDIKKIESQAQISSAQPTGTTMAKQSSSNFLLETFATKTDDKKSTIPPKTAHQSGSNLLASLVPKETKPSPAKAAPAPQKQEPLSDPDDFLAKLFPDKFGGAKKSDDKPKGGPASSLFGERKPNKSAFFIGEDSDSETVDIPKKKKSDDDFDFFS